MNPLRSTARLLAVLADRVMATPPTTWASASYGTDSGAARQRTPGTPAPAAEPPLRRPVRGQYSGRAS